MKRAKTLISVSLIFVFLLQLVSCTHSTTTSSETSVTENTTTEEEPQEISEFTMFSTLWGIESSSDGEIKKLIADKTGVLVHESFISGTDWNFNTLIDDMLALPDDSIPDIIYTTFDAHKLYESGRAVAWDQYLEKYPRLKELHTDEEWDKLRQEDGHIYWADFEDCFKDKDTSVTHIGDAFWIQVRVLEWAGYPKIETLDEYFDLLERYSEEYPVLPDGTEVIPYACSMETVPGKPAMYMEGYPDNDFAIVDNNNGDPKVIDYTTSDTSKNYFKKLNEEYEKGVLTSYPQGQFNSYREDISSGRVLGFFDNYSAIAQFTDTFSKPRTDVDGHKFYLSELGYDYVPLGLVSQKGMKQQYHSYNVMNDDWGLVVMDKCSDPDKVFEFFDALLDQEIHDLRFWGIKDVDYLVDDNGIYYRTEEMRNNWSDDHYCADHVCKYLGLPHWHGMRPEGFNRMISDEQPSEFKATLPAPVAKCLDAYAADNFVEMLDSEICDPYPWYPLGTWIENMDKTSPYYNTFNEINSFKEEWFNLLITSSDFNKEWETFISEYSKLETQGLFDAAQEEVENRL
ncbi:MAG: sugar ABC transporter substrate-binding protein [Clostridiales bacterium]|nr:sugar ABC transporter substrate-binding protein [Clostridiales bacterium]